QKRHQEHDRDGDRIDIGPPAGGALRLHAQPIGDQRRGQPAERIGLQIDPEGVELRIHAPGSCAAPPIRRSMPTKTSAVTTMVSAVDPMRAASSATASASSRATWTMMPTPAGMNSSEKLASRSWLVLPRLAGTPRRKARKPSMMTAPSTGPGTGMSMARTTLSPASWQSRGRMPASIIASGRARPDFLLQPLAERVPRDVQIVARLEIEPELRLHPEIPAEAQGRVRGDGPLAEHDLVDPPRRHADRLG